MFPEGFGKWFAQLIWNLAIGALLKQHKGAGGKPACDNPCSVTCCTRAEVQAIGFEADD